LLAQSAMPTKGKRWKRLATAAMIAGAAAPGVLRWVRRAGAAKRAIDLRMTVVVERPIHEVFEFCRDFQNFPEVVNLLMEVDDSQDGRSRWTVRSPSGEAITWDATVTKYVPNSVIAWQSVPGSAVYAGGTMRFFPLSARDTRVDVVLTDRPFETGLGDALRALVARSNDGRLRAELRQASRSLAADAPRSSEALGPAA